MNLDSTWSYSGIDYQGLSLSGIRTAMTLPQYGLCFDVAQGFPFVLNQKKYFITHGHLDHAAGIPYIISQKMMNNNKPPEFFMPTSLVEPMKQIMNLWQDIEKHKYNFIFSPVSDLQRIEINPQLYVEAFRTVHRIESFGYSLIKRNKKLKRQFLNLPQSELLQKKDQGHILEEIEETRLMSFTGDTQIEFLDCSPQVKESQVLFIECTYLDEQKSSQHAKEWGHLHLDELIPRLSEIKSEKIVLIHISSRYSNQAIKAILDQKIPNHEKDRVVFFPGR